MTITSFYEVGTSPTAYIIVCPYEGNFGAKDIAIKSLTTLTVTFSTWTWPDYYGEGAYIGTHIRYLWTDKLGNLIGYLAEAKKSTARENCTLGSAHSIYS